MAVALLATACTTGPDETGAEAGDGYIRFTFAQPETWAELGTDGAGRFTEGDRIGLFVDNGSEVAYRELTYTAGSWEPLLRRSDFGDGELVISAHYPADSGAEAEPANRIFRVATDQTGAGRTASDVLFARQNLGAGVYRADMTFRHLMHRLRISLGETSEGVTVAVRSRTDGELNLLTGEATVTGDFAWIQPAQTADGTLEAVIFPQAAEPYRSGEGLLRITSDDREATYLLPEQIDGQPLTAFEAGRQTTVRLTVKSEGGGSADLAGKTVWVYGVHAPDFPGKENIPSYPPYQTEFPMGAWFRYNWTFEEAQYLTWEENCGWFDCNKSAGYVENDGKLCWAVSGSNLLLWWLANNRAYVEVYDRDYGAQVMAGTEVVERPSTEFKPLYSGGTVNRAPMFEFFKAHFGNRSGWDSSAVNWFVTGNTTNLVTPDLTGFPGFFSEVFDQSDIIAVDSPRMPTGKQFNEFVIDALLNHQALSLSVYGVSGPNTGNHALTVWGAEFDDEGRVSHIYYCDNNNSDQDANGAEIARYKIVYGTASSIPELGDREYTYMQGLDNEEGNPKAKFKILCVSAVDLRQDIWARKYPSVKVDEQGK